MQKRFDLLYVLGFFGSVLLSSIVTLSHHLSVLFSNFLLVQLQLPNVL